MTMLETKAELENALYNGNPLSFNAMMNCYIAIQNFITAHGNKDITVEIYTSEVKI